MQKKFVSICLFNFLVAALMGLLLRFAFVHPMAINFRFLTHAHSHVAMLGWVYLILYLLLIHHFVPDKKPIYTRLFWWTQIAIIGMMVSFPFQGYAAVSITFSTLHIFCSYYFVRLIWKHHLVASMPVRWLLKASLLFMLISTIGIWCLGPAVGLLGQASAFYQIAIQFFLHFQFNGWFLFAVLAVFFHHFPIKKNNYFKHFFKILIMSTLLTLALPISWFINQSIWLWINGLGVVLQFLAAFFFVQMLRSSWSNFLSNTSQLARSMYALALASFFLKMFLQTLSVVPEIATMAFQYRNFVVGFIHLMMLGVISGFLFAFVLNSNLLPRHSKLLKIGVYTFFIGFVSTEILLLLQGMFYYLSYGMVPNYYMLLFLCSMLLPLSILLFIIKLLNHETQTVKETSSPSTFK